MRLYVCVLGVLAVFCSVLAAPSQDNLVEVFRDDFTRDGGLDPEKWNIADSDAAPHGEVGSYKASNVAIRNGSLVLGAIRNGALYEAAQVFSVAKYKFLYGEVEWRAIMPIGDYVWTGLWLTGIHYNPNNSLELTDPYSHAPAICFMDQGGHTSMHAYYADKTPEKKVDVIYGMDSNIFITDTTDDYHVYKMVWTEDSVTWYIDGQRAFSVLDADRIPHEALHMVISMGVGGMYARYSVPNDTLPFPVQEMLIDYVSVRQFTKPERTTGDRVPRYVGWTIGALAAVLLAVLLAAGALFFYKFRQRDWVVPKNDSRRATLLAPVFDDE